MRSARSDVALLLLRLALGLSLTAHGAHMLLSSSDGGGLGATIATFHSRYGLPAWIAVLASLANLAFGLLLFAGLLTRVAALWLAVEMAVAMGVSGQVAHGYLGVSGAHHGEGYELCLTLLLCALALLAGGSGRMGVDRLVRERLRR